MTAASSVPSWPWFIGLGIILLALFVGAFISAGRGPTEWEQEQLSAGSRMRSDDLAWGFEQAEKIRDERAVTPASYRNELDR